MEMPQCRFRVPGPAPGESRCTHPHVRAAGQIVACDVCAACLKRQVNPADGAIAPPPARSDAVCDFELVRGNRALRFDEADWSRMIREGGVVRCETV